MELVFEVGIDKLFLLPLKSVCTVQILTILVNLDQIFIRNRSWMVLLKMIIIQPDSTLIVPYPILLIEYEFPILSYPFLTDNISLGPRFLVWVDVIFILQVIILFRLI